MIGTSSVYQDFIAHELDIIVPPLSETVIEKLSSVAEQFVNDEITKEEAIAVFSEHSAPNSLLVKIDRIKEVIKEPLPSQNIALIANNASSSVAGNVANKVTKNINTGLNNSIVTLGEHQAVMPSNERKKSMLWTDEEDIRLTAAVIRFGNRDWRVISAFVGTGRSSSQCNQRWTRALNPRISRRPWNEEEDEILLKTVREKGECGWRKIAATLKGRTDLQCRHRYIQLKKQKSANYHSGISSQMIFPHSNISPNISLLPHISSISPHSSDLQLSRSMSSIYNTNSCNMNINITHNTHPANYGMNISMINDYHEITSDNSINSYLSDSGSDSSNDFATYPNSNHTSRLKVMSPAQTELKAATPVNSVTLLTRIPILNPSMLFTKNDLPPFIDRRASCHV